MNAPARAPAAERNCEPILGVLMHEFRNCSRVLEIGSGCGYHAVRFGAAMPHLIWQTSDLDANHANIVAQIGEAKTDNVLPPLSLDVRSAAPDGTYDAVYSSNTAHIMSAGAVERMLPFVAASLSAGGIFCYYGPFTRRGRFNTPSNAAFDASLRAGDPLMGVRELDEFDARLDEGGLRRVRTYAMPANNLLVVWAKTD